MARTAELFKIAQKFDLKFITIKDLIEYRIKNESLITEEALVELPTEFECLSPPRCPRFRTAQGTRWLVWATS